jgi:hypothetical protein
MIGRWTKIDITSHAQMHRNRRLKAFGDAGYDLCRALLSEVLVNQELGCSRYRSWSIDAACDRSYPYHHWGTVPDVLAERTFRGIAPADGDRYATDHTSDRTDIPASAR